MTSKLPRCKCRSKAIAFAPGSSPSYAPGGILTDRGRPVEAWCQRCATARTWLAEPIPVIGAAASRTPRSGRKTALASG